MQFKEKSNWKECILEKCCRCFDNKRKPISSELREKGSIPYYGANGIQDYVKDYIFNGEYILLAEDGGHFDEFLNKPIAQYITGKSWVNNHAHVLQGKNDNITQYIFYSLVHKDIRKYINGSSRAKLNKEDMWQIKIFLPETALQQKIANFLSLVDQRIEKQRQLVESLKKYKRGLLSAIFDNKLIGENWKKYKLSSILKERSTYSEKDGSYEHVTLSRDGIIPKTERYDRDFLVSSENKKYKITKMGDICYNPANMKFGVICLNTYGNAIFSPIYITFEIKSDFDKPFVGLYMTRNDFINRSLKFQQGTVYERMAVSPEDLLSMDIELPNLEAQKRISNIFTILDKKIVRENNIFNELQKMKRALLQQMFI